MFVLDYLQADVPGLGAVFAENFAMRDLQTVRSQISLVIVHGLQLHEHTFFDRIDEFAVLRGGEAVSFEPVGDSKDAVWFQEFGSRSKEFGTILVVRDGFHGPENVELVREIHGFGVHQEERCVEASLRRSLSGDFDLCGRDGDAGHGGVEFFGEEESAGAKAATDVQDVRMRLYVCELGEMFDELKLCLFLGFIAANPVTVVEMFTPERAVIRAKEIVVLDDFLFVVGTRQRQRLVS